MAVAIWVMAADGSSPRRLSRSSGDDHGPRWSPDGRQIAFNSSRLGDIEVYVMAADGSDQRNSSRSPGTDEAERRRAGHRTAARS